MLSVMMAVILNAGSLTPLTVTELFERLMNVCRIVLLVKFNKAVKLILATVSFSKILAAGDCVWLIVRLSPPMMCKLVVVELRVRLLMAPALLLLMANASPVALYTSKSLTVNPWIFERIAPCFVPRIVAP